MEIAPKHSAKSRRSFLSSCATSTSVAWIASNLAGCGKAPNQAVVSDGNGGASLPMAQHPTGAEQPTTEPTNGQRRPYELKLVHEIFVNGQCTNCKTTDCVVVCPVECFYEGPRMLYIHPDECINCEACIAECPNNAIRLVTDNPSDEDKIYSMLNDVMARVSPNIKERKAPLRNS